MSETPSAPRDPLIEEVRERRRELWLECGGDLKKLHEAIKRLQAEHPEKVFDRRQKRETSLGGER